MLWVLSRILIKVQEGARRQREKSVGVEGNGMSLWVTITSRLCTNYDPCKRSLYVIILIKKITLCSCPTNYFLVHKFIIITRTFPSSVWVFFVIIFIKKCKIPNGNLFFLLFCVKFLHARIAQSRTNNNIELLNNKSSPFSMRIFLPSSVQCLCRKLICIIKQQQHIHTHRPWLLPI